MKEKTADSNLSFERTVAHVERAIDELSEAAKFFAEVGLQTQADILDAACQHLEDEILTTLEMLQGAVKADLGAQARKVSKRVAAEATKTLRPRPTALAAAA